MAAFRKVKANITDADVALVEDFYKQPKSTECDQTWNRKSGVTQLLNQWTQQVDLARAFKGSGGSKRQAGPPICGNSVGNLSAQYGES